mmetsp:Transcript_57405/g.186488  ORF Transcript_57405/g.186488 Transcript_57405/m.186488 type:complete len:284 (+) Transcript_57405:582-1433(+)
MLPVGGLRCTSTSMGSLCWAAPNTAGCCALRAGTLKAIVRPRMPSSLPLPSTATTTVPHGVAAIRSLPTAPEKRLWYSSAPKGVRSTTTHAGTGHHPKRLGGGGGGRASPGRRATAGAPTAELAGLRRSWQTTCPTGRRAATLGSLAGWHGWTLRRTSSSSATAMPRACAGRMAHCGSVRTAAHGGHTSVRSSMAPSRTRRCLSGGRARRARAGYIASSRAVIWAHSVGSRGSTRLGSPLRNDQRVGCDDAWHKAHYPCGAASEESVHGGNSRYDLRSISNHP